MKNARPCTYITYVLRWWWWWWYPNCSIRRFIFLFHLSTTVQWRNNTAPWSHWCHSLRTKCMFEIVVRVAFGMVCSTCTRDMKVCVEWIGRWSRWHWWSVKHCVIVITVPGPITDHKFTTYNGITIRWNPPINKNGKLLYYLVEWTVDNSTRAENVSIATRPNDSGFTNVFKVSLQWVTQTYRNAQIV